MNTPLLILAAIVIPLTVLAFLLLFTRAAIWLALRPRTRAIIFGALGVLYVVIGIWEAQTAGWRDFSFFQISMGIFWIAYAIYDYRKGVSQSLE